MVRSLILVAAAFVVARPSLCADEFLKNGGFEAVHALKGVPSRDVGFGVWRLTPTPSAPDRWVLNAGYPGGNAQHILGYFERDHHDAVPITADDVAGAD